MRISLLKFATTILRLSPKGSGPIVDKSLAGKAGIGFIGGKAIGDIVDAQGHAIADALNKAGRLVRTIDVAHLNAHSAGALLMHFMMETIVAGYR